MTVFYFEKEARNSVKVYIFRFINIPATNQSSGHFDTLQDIGESDSTRKYMANTCDFRRYFIFLETKTFLFFSLLFIVHL